ncbi:MAG TPA: hypothetical protein DEV93_09350 [Chloroflexi bacterium]|nr:hypothetical protein [Chloroflexota bacterium]
MQRILVVRNGGLGDTLLTVPAIRALHRCYPDASIEVAGNTEYWSVARDLVDAIYRADDPAIAEIFATGPRHNFSKRFENVDLLISWSTQPLKDGAEKLPTLVSANPHPPPGVHASDWLVSTLTDQAVLEASNDDRELCLTLSAEANTQADAVFESLGLSRPVLIHPGAGAHWKRWPADRFAELAGRLLHRGHEVAMLAGPADDGAARMVQGVVPIAVVRETRPPVVAAILGRSPAFAGNDSGISHLAAAVGAPGVALFGPTDPASWAPRGRIEVVRSCVKPASYQGQIRVCENADCMSSIGVSEVYLALERVLAREQGKA